uniref:Thioredoxin domain-containing protein n=1 Tax=Chrysotila carterae TaxID=13221 RepID=A0A7S4B684_CHRCT|mmetsp:Transcript_40104/g.88051  ORF Transcript_40104/g.88051 Transcript_40104/m.88051 type:complete len:158 (-) Transcript_40104:345-818(-)
MLDAIFDFVYRNPFLVLAICFFLYRSYQSRQPWPDYGGKVVSVHSLDELKTLQTQSAAESKLLLVDCYATWCPPCKAAAPVYARMSEEYANCVFSKVDVDKAGEVSSHLGVTSMPTFKIFRGPRELGTCQGWQESAVRRLLDAHGARLGSAAETKTD